MSYEHCEKHDRDATNGCSECDLDRQMAECQRMGGIQPTRDQMSALISACACGTSDAAPGIWCDVRDQVLESAAKALEEEAKGLPERDRAGSDDDHMAMDLEYAAEKIRAMKGGGR